MERPLRNFALVIVGLILLGCDNAHRRDPGIVAREEFERSKPRLFPVGGVYMDSVAVSVAVNHGNIEYALKDTYSTWPGQALVLSESTGVSVRDRRDHDLVAKENYVVLQDFPELTLFPPPGEYAGAQVVAIVGIPLNASAEINTPAGYIVYRRDDGILVNQTMRLEIRMCTPARCALPQSFSYTVAPAIPTEERKLTAAELTELNDAAKHRYSQTEPRGLSALLDEAKSRVILNESLIYDAATRRRFLAQDNNLAAENLCTTVARFLYVKARRLALGISEPAMPDFAGYYITHVARGNITTDSLGQNFDWVLNGPALVIPYLPAHALSAFEFSRTNAYPTDYALLDALGARSPGVVLLRDGPTAFANTHTFLAVSNGTDFTMIDTYFSQFSGSPLRGWSGYSGYYAYRFGPQGSRFLHYVYGY